MEIWDTSKLQKARKDANLKAMDVATRVDITAPYLSGVENGVYQPSAQLVAKLSDIYKMPIAYFLTSKSNSESA